SAQFQEAPYLFYKELRDQHPLFFDERLNAYVISRYADISYALQDPSFTVRNYAFQSEPLHGRTFIQMDGLEHSKYRNAVAPHIRGNTLHRKIVPMIEEIAAGLYQNFQGRNQIDFAQSFAARFPILVIVGLLGLNPEDERHFLTWYRRFVAFIADMGQSPEITEEAFRSKEEITNYLMPIIQQKRRHSGQDLLSFMCHYTIDGVRLSDEEIKAFISLLITAGGESTDKMLSLTLRNLLQHPAQMQAVREDRSLIAAAFAESMRYSPVTHRLMRITSAPVELSGGKIPSESSVILLLGAAQHDERQFKNPEHFNLFREDLPIDKAFNGAANHVAFGGGRHFCVGAALAKAEIEIAFNQLFDLTRHIQLDGTTFPSEIGLFTRGLPSLPIAYRLS
ncbi:MAG: cytochrome P450, partial [Bacteroidota bacterium]